MIERPHLLGIDDGPFDKWAGGQVVIAGVMMEGPNRIENIALTRFPVDGAAATEFLAEWVGSLRFAPSLQGVVIAGITVAGLGVVDIAALAEILSTPVIAVNRKDPAKSRLVEALRASQVADRETRIAVVCASPPARRIASGLFVSCAGVPASRAHAWVEASRDKSDFPEALRVAHLTAQAVATGQSLGRA